mgnify:CR=1 FL=1
MKEHVVSYFFACCVVVLKLILLILCPINLLAKDITIGVIIDGQSESTNVLISELKQELSEIAGRDFIANFDPKYQLDGEWNLATIRQQVTDLASQSDIDILLTLGVIGSQQTIAVNRSIPVIAPLVFNNTVQGFPISQQDTSGLKNLHYLTAKHDFRSEIIEFQALTNANDIAIVIDELLIEALPHLITVIDNFFSNEAFNVHIVSINDDGWQIANHIDAVFLTSLKRLSVAEMKSLIEHINMRGLPSYSAEGKPIVSLGVLMGKQLVPTTSQLARQLAIDIRDIVLGRSASELPIYLEIGGSAFLNGKTATQINYSPPFDLLFEAEMVTAFDDYGRELTLQSVIEESLHRNLQYKLAQQTISETQQDIKIARASLLPQVSIGINNLAENIQSTTKIKTNTSTASLNLSQNIYKESAKADYDIAQNLQLASVADADSIKLDVIEETATAYLNALSAKTQLSIQQNNSHVTRENLERARFRLSVGSSDRSAVLRFESELGRNRQDISSAQALYELTKKNLNQILQQPSELAFTTEEPSISAPHIFGDERIINYITNPRRARIFRDYLVHRALSDYPELRSLDQLIEAQRRSVLAAKRARYLPDISVSAGIDRLLEDYGSDQSFSYDEDWRINLDLSLPIYQGARLKADYQRATVRLSQLITLRQQLVDNIDATIRRSVHQASSSRINIRFAQQSAQAADQALELVTDAYIRGAASDSDLIDAQNTALVAQLSSADASFRFLIDLMSLERAIGFFDFSVPDDIKEDWLEQLYTFTQQYAEQE